MAAGKRTRVPHHQGLWERHRANDKVYELKLDGASGTYPIAFPLDRVDPPREVLAWWKEKTLKKERTGQGLPTRKRLDDLAAEAFAALDERIKVGGRKAPSARTVALYRGDYERYVKPTFGHEYAHKITHEDVLDWLAWLRDQKGRGDKKLASWTVNGKLTVLRHVLKYGRRTGAVDHNVFDRIDSADLPDQEHRDDFDARALTVAELRRLIDAATGDERTVIVVLGYTGMRRGECAGLLWSDLDLVDEEIRLTLQLGDLVDGKATRVPLKNKWARDVILLDPAKEALVEHLAREQEKGRGQLDDFVFTDADGKVRNLAWYSNVVKRVGVKAKLGDNVTPQVLRRTAATVFAYAEIPIHVAAKMLGHSVEVFVKHYVQVYKDAQARKAMREQLGKVKGYVE